MRLSRARYVTLCQQSLVTAVVLAVAASAAGVRTLDIVPTPGGSGGLGAAVSVPDETVLRERELEATVETAPVMPQVREVEVETTAPVPQQQRTAPPTEKRGSEPERAAGPAATQEPTAAPEQEQAKEPEQEQAEEPVEGQRLVAQSEPEQVDGYATVGVTWTSAPDGTQYADDDITVELRSKVDGDWSPWTPAEYQDEHGPDGAEAGRAEERAGTEAVVVGEVEQVQMRASTADGTAPRDLQLSVIDPGIGATTTEAPAIDTGDLPQETPGGTGAAQGEPQAASRTTEPDGAGDAEADDTVELSAMKVAAKPTIYSRAQWGANDRLRDKGSLRYGTVKTGFVHHTVNANNYSRDDVPALLRGIYAYHTQSRGWSDIGYNFLIDRFGRIWEGRYGGVGKAVVGAHTLGYNESSFAASAIGNFDVAAPPPAVAAANARLFAWKLSLAGIRADATGLRVAGRTLRAINGHRDAGSTACPGRYLYSQLGSIRATARSVQAQAGGGSAPPPPPPPAPAPPTGFVSPTQAPITWHTQPRDLTLPTKRSLVGDAYPDLVVKRRDGVLHTVSTGGQMGFAKRTRTPGDWRSKNLVVAVGDVTGDGKGDVLSRAAKTGVVRIHRGDGAGRVAPTGFQRTNQFARAKRITAAGDWSGDGKADLLVVTSGNALRVWNGRGNGTFTPGAVLARSWDGYGQAVVTRDLTGDGRDDVVAVDAARRLVVLPATAARGLGAPVSRRALGGAPRAVSSAPGSAGDLTGDGIGDVMVQFGGRRYGYVVGGAGSGALGATRLGAFPASADLSRLSVGQMTGSAQGDMVGVGPDGRGLIVVSHNGLRDAQLVQRSNLTLPGATQVLSVGDWNGDGHGDIVTREEGGDRLNLRIGNSRGIFSSAKTLGTGWKGFTRLAAVGDISGDGRPDLVGVTSAGAVRVFLGDGKLGLAGVRTAPKSLRTFNMVGSGSWSPASTGSRYLSSDGSLVPAAGRAASLRGYDWVVGAGDVDGDGRRDLIARASGGNLWLLPGTATGVGPRRFLGLNLAGYSTGG